MSSPEISLELQKKRVSELKTALSLSQVQLVVKNFLSKKSGEPRDEFKKVFAQNESSIKFIDNLVNLALENLDLESSSPDQGEFLRIKIARAESNIAWISELVHSVSVNLQLLP